MPKEKQIQREKILETLRESGCRITKQRLLVLDTILENDCQTCKEIFYIASKKDKTLGVATVYRMVSILEEFGVLSRKNLCMSSI